MHLTFIAAQIIDTCIYIHIHRICMNTYFVCICMYFVHTLTKYVQILTCNLNIKKVICTFLNLKNGYVFDIQKYVKIRSNNSVHICMYLHVYACIWQYEHAYLWAGCQSYWKASFTCNTCIYMQYMHHTCRWSDCQYMHVYASICMYTLVFLWIQQQTG